MSVSRGTGYMVLTMNQRCCTCTRRLNITFTATKESTTYLPFVEAGKSYCGDCMKHLETTFAAEAPLADIVRYVHVALSPTALKLMKARLAAGK